MVQLLKQSYGNIFLIGNLMDENSEDNTVLVVIF